MSLTHVSQPNFTFPEPSSDFFSAFRVSWSEQLGTGRSGPIRIAHCNTSGKTYALKILRDTEDARHEVAVHVALCKTSERIAQVVGVYTERYQLKDDLEPFQYIFVVLERAWMDLVTYANKERGLSEQKSKKIVKQVLEALHHIHAFGLVHHDVKPENILINHNLDVVVSDFGFVHCCGSNTRQMTRCTPAYASPEILYSAHLVNKHRTPEHITTSSDIWSLGVTLFAVMSLRLPFGKGKTTVEIGKIMNASVSFSEATWWNVSQECKNVIQAMLQSKPTQRPSAAEILESTWMADVN